MTLLGNTILENGISSVRGLSAAELKQVKAGNILDPISERAPQTQPVK